MTLFRMTPFAAVLLSLPAAAWAQTEWTEHRVPADATGDEQRVLELINRARANPFAEGTRLATNSPYPLPGGDITEGLPSPGNVGVRPPLAMNGTLLSIARIHSQDMWTNNYFAHNTPGGTTPGQRATAAGYSGSAIGENIATSSSGTASYLEDFLMVDWLSSGGYPGRGHRSNLLDVDSYGFREIGVGYYHGSSVKSAALQDLLTEDFGVRTGVGPFLVGVVWDDTGNSFYTAGKGYGGVDVRTIPAGTHYAVTGGAGGYAFPVGTSGTVVVRATGVGPGNATIYKAVTLRGQSVKVDFRLSDASIVDSDTDGLPDSWETAHFTNLGQTAGMDTDGDTYTNAEELAAGTDPMDPGSKPGAVGPGGAPPSTKSGGGGGGGGCGLTGLEAALLLGLLRRVRRR